MTGAPGVAPVAEAVAAELATLLYRQSYGVLFANFAVAVPVAYVMREIVPGGPLLAWLGAVYLLTLARVVVCRRFLRRGAGPLRPWVAGFCALSWSSGLLWGLAGLAAVLSGQDMMLAFGCVILAGMCSGAVPSLSAYPPAYAGSALGMVAPFILACLAAADGLHLVYAAFGVCLLAVNLYFSAVTYRSLKTTVALRFENTALIRGLERERDRVAAADRAKTRFLAAAGHDLRQPVHALGMFTDILASRAEDGSVTAQDALHVARRQQAVLDSLNRLLDGLLDVSRMDAHLLRIERRTVHLDALFDDIRLDFEPQARARGLRLSVAPTRLALDTAPALLRRILDNLLRNALSYTLQGRVLLSARRRRGGVVIQVWDTGVGIAPELQEAVFTEFMRGAGAPAAPGSEEGLGLGLAIVRRLAGLLHGEISLRSVPGKGSVFSLWVPAGIPAAHAAGEK
ncbi:sensor histidine kinase [Achromobacter ruhlandii]|uniref:histidine kinase n=1 Tax=Achromobacter ruhlandii TaxID=72557 RepID=A0ABM8LRQ9_9BURK|nr:HAMP domain-containing sensor histidine kinase [Achromobacter ruhlandii]AKP92266.1 two-component hybrid sensor and regulator [Achromobacter xylosoxidans]AOU95526.1 histidine kinase A [Achromobacter ruhlandii]CAB3940708.1 Adaptive-response sensory-kinase SasA [Achromobacter ruhlandii]